MLAGTPLGIWMLVRLYWDGGPIPAEHVWLHAHLQVFGFFGTLIVGVAHHLVPRFAGRPVAAASQTPWLAAALGAGLLLRIGGTAAGMTAPVVGAALLQGLAFGCFGAWVARALPAPHLRLARAHLTVATAWLVAALVLEAGLRAWSPAPGGPHVGGMRAAHAMAVYGGVVGWIVGVVLRAGPMLVARWRIPDVLARLAPGALGLGVVLASLGSAGPWSGATGVALERAGEAVALGTVAALALSGGAFRRAPGALPLLDRGGPETRLFRMAMLAAAVAAAGSAGAAAMAWTGAPLSLLADALRHLVTVGFLTSMVVGMGLRLIPVLEGVALPWPRLRGLAFWTLLAGVLLRTAEALADYGLAAVLPLVPFSGVLVWMALACLGAGFLGASRRRAAL
ncbi:MAG TPA: hypothetical protein VHF87_20300 [Methylomirabilota bacterium]|nr:hypothetical protein [Methylomirabilota bacterium]